jgi:hypothetical protein
MSDRYNFSKTSKSRIGGFVSLNCGEIRDCYSVVELKKSKLSNRNTDNNMYNSRLTEGFAGENSGKILHSFSSASIRRERVKSNADAAKRGFDTDKIWEYTDQSQVLRFIPEYWIYKVADSELYPDCPDCPECENVSYMSKMRIPGWCRVNAQIIENIAQMPANSLDCGKNVYIHLDLQDIVPENVEAGVVRSLDEIVALDDIIKPSNCVFAPGFVSLDFAKVNGKSKLNAAIISSSDEILDISKRIDSDVDNIALSYIKIELGLIPADYDEKVKVNIIGDNSQLAALIKKVKKIKRGNNNHVLIQISADSPPIEITLEEKAPFVSIRTADELFAFAAKVNSGDKEMAAAYVRLENDIDLSGKQWIPIGCESGRSFNGLFDGGGYIVRNFVIKSSKSKFIKARGFFGYLKGEVYNLTADCYIKADDGVTAGGIAAFCEKGVIGCCAAIVNISCKSAICRINCGGIVGLNSGRIVQSYCAGKIGIIILPWWAGVPIPLLALLIYMLMFMSGTVIPEADAGIRIFPPPPTDPGIVRNEDEIANPPRHSDHNFVSFEFEHEVKVNLDSGECRFNFKNPGNSNHDIILILQMTDESAIRAMGSTGRLPEEQSKLSGNPDYDPKNHRVNLAESGAIPAGYSLENLVLTRQPNGSILTPGRHPAIAFLILYDTENHSRAMLDTQLPVVLIVE